MSKEVLEYRRFAITAAKELFYPEAVLASLRKAKTENEIAYIMRSARERSK